MRVRSDSRISEYYVVAISLFHLLDVEICGEVVLSVDEAFRRFIIVDVYLLVFWFFARCDAQLCR